MNTEVTDTIVVGDMLNLYSKITEEDPSSNDVGSNRESVPVTLDQIENGIPATVDVNVHENHGHGAGKSANWESNFYIRKIKKIKHSPQLDEKSKLDVSSWEVFKLTMKNLF